MTVIDEATGRRVPLYAQALIDRWDDGARAPKIREYIRPSDAKKCARYLGYIACGMDGAPMDSSGIFNTTLGNILHGEVQRAMETHFAALRELWNAENDEPPEVGVPWRIVCEYPFDNVDFPIEGYVVKVTGFADVVIYDAHDNVLEVGDYKSKGGYAFKKALGLMGRDDKGADDAAWVQTWIYATLLGAPLVSVVHIGKECVSFREAGRAGFETTDERFWTEFVKPREELDEMGFAEVRRMWLVNQLVQTGMLPKRTIPDEGSGTEIVAPGTGLFDDGTTTWRCVGYCSAQEQCISDGPGRVPIPETSLLAIRRKEEAVV